MTNAIEKIRNIGIIAHIDAGKTTTTERILYYTGSSHRMGDVDEGTTETDFDPEEQERGITIYSAAVSCRWKDYEINLIDTPGHVDFTAEVERSLRVLDGGVVIFSAREGVEAQSETVWRQADKYRVPRICFINKMDRIGASFERTFDQIQNRLSGTPLAIQLPIGAGSPPESNYFRGIIDLVEQKALYFEKDDLGTSMRSDEIPEDLREGANAARRVVLDAVAMLDDVVLETYMTTDDIPVEDIRRLLRKGVLGGHFHVVLCGTSLNYIGVQPLLDAVGHYLPSPLDIPPVEGIRPEGKKAGEKETRGPSEKDPLCALVFKIVGDAHGDLCFTRVYSGVLSSRSRLLNPRTGKKELISQLWHIQASSREKVDECGPGSIVGIIGPKEVVTGDTLCDQHHAILLESISFPETVISMVVEPESSADRKKLSETLRLLSRQDPTFQAKEEENGQTTIRGMGELHLEVIRHRIERDYRLNVRVHKPRVSYRETVKNAVESEGSFNRQASGVTQACKVKIRIEPFNSETPVTLVNQMKPGVIPAEVTPLLEQTIREESSGGGTLGCPLMHVKITILDVDYSAVETTEVALQAAALDAVRQGLHQAGVVLLEPVMRLEVVTPDEFLGNIQSDLLARKAAIVNTESRGDLIVLTAEAPLARMFGYSTQVRSLSQGRASYSMEPLKYDVAPPEVLKEMMGE